MAWKGRQFWLLTCLLQLAWCRVLHEEHPRILARLRTKNRSSLKVVEMPPSYPISILADARVLITGRFGKAESLGHAPVMFYSIYRKHQLLTGLYWDAMATLPAYIPEGPLAVLGLGAGTFVRIIHALYPDLDIKAWDVEPEVVEVGRRYLGLKEIEDNGKLRVFIEDAMTGSALKHGPYAGIIVDMFHGDKILPALQQLSTWKMFRSWLVPGGRIMFNMGWEKAPAFGETWAAVKEAFDDQVLVNHYRFRESRQSLGLTGPMADFPGLVPFDLRNVSTGWQHCTELQEPCYPEGWR